MGYFGVVQNRPGVDPSLVRELLESNLSRGDRSWGLYCWSPSRSMVLRSTEKWDPYTLHIPGTLDQGTDISWAQVVLGHVRAPTSGESRLLDTHPFETERFLLAMNGIFTQYPERAEESRVDTAQLAEFLQTASFSSPSERVQRAFEGDFVGQFACWLWDKRKEQLFLWRGTNPIFFYQDLLENGRTRVVFSSSMNNLSRTILFEGTIFRLDPRHLEVDDPRRLDLWSMGTFSTSSIYSFVDLPPSSDIGE